jgi:SAM-dependent MidA family methyltransferase
MNAPGPPTALEQQIFDLIAREGRISFARFMQLCLYSAHGGFYRARASGIGTHFGTSAMSHPAFGALIARQLDQMWQLLGEPRVFHVIEVGSGDGALARSIVQACLRSTPHFARALRYVATDYAPRWLHASDQAAGWRTDAADGSVSSDDAAMRIERVQADGLRAFSGAIGCILSNELLDNFPVHRFEVRNGGLQEIFVTQAEGRLVEVLAEPSTPRIAARLRDLGVSLPDGFRGEVNLALEDWSVDVARALARGFVLTIDYGDLAQDLYAAGRRGGTLVCYRQHEASDDPLAHAGQQDITSHVDFTSLMRLGERHGLATVGYARQREFLQNLGFSSLADALVPQAAADARATLDRMALMALVDPAEYGDLKVLAQAKGFDPGVELQGFSGATSEPRPAAERPGA